MGTDRKFPLPIPNSNNPAEIGRVLRTWAQILSDSSGSGSSTTSTTITGGGGGIGTPAPDPEDWTDYLTPTDKIFYKHRWDVCTSEVGTLTDQADQIGNTVEKGAYLLAYGNLDGFLHDTGTAPDSRYNSAGKDWLTAGWNTLDNTKKFLGPGGKKYWLNIWALYDAALRALLAAIDQGGLDPGVPTDVIRPTIIWDFSGTNAPTKPSSGTPSPTNPAPSTVTANTSFLAPASPYALTGSQFISSLGSISRLTFPTQSLLYIVPYNSVEAANPTYPSGVSPQECYVLAARVRWNGSGTWRGKVLWAGTGGSQGTLVKSVGAPTANVWTDKVWDMHNLDAGGSGTAFMSMTAITQFQFDLVENGTVEVDWALCGKYGAGSKAEYDNFVSNQATLSLLRSNFQSILQAQGLNIPHIFASSGSFPALPNASYPVGYLIMAADTGFMYRNLANTWTKIPAATVIAGTIVAGVVGADELAANSVYTKNIVVANFDNLVPNFNSELQPRNSDGTTKSAWTASEYAATGPLESRLVYGSFGQGGSPYGFAGSNCRKGNGTSVDLTGDIQVVEGDVYSINAMFQGYWNGSSYEPAYLELYDKSGVAGAWGAYTSRIAGTSTGTWTPDANGIVYTVPAGITHIKIALNGTGYADNLYLRKAADARLLVDGTIQGRHLMASTIQGYHLAVGPMYQFTSNIADSHGSYAIGTYNDGTYGQNDSTRKTYVDTTRLYPTPSATIGGNTYEANFSGTGGDRGIVFCLASAWGNGLIARQTATTVTLNDYTGSAIGNGTISTQRGTYTIARNATDKLSAVVNADGTVNVFLNGKKLITYNPGAAAGGYAGIYLDHSADRVWGIGMGRGFVTLQDGVVTADTINTDLALAGVVRAPGYSAGTTSLAPSGYKLAGTAFTTTFLDTAHGGHGGTDANCYMEIAGTANFGGYKVATLNDRVFTQFNRIPNGTCYRLNTSTDPLGWQGYHPDSPATTFIGPTPRSVGVLGQDIDSMVSSGSSTYSVPFTVPKSTSATLSFYKAIQGLSGGTIFPQIQVSIISPDGTATGVYSWAPGSSVVPATPTWTQSTVDITSYISNAGSYVLSVYIGVNRGTAPNAYVGACDFSLIL